ncbi:MAG: O-antigen ligase family protein [Myxococcales bacterium]|nr:O-antigen ligase family protein [Myxococcales bacterium]
MSPPHRGNVQGNAEDSPSSSGRDRVIDWLILALVTGAPLCLGGMHPWAQVALSAATIVLWVAHATSRLVFGRRMVWPIGTLVLLATAAWVGLMSVPVPVSWLPAFHTTVHAWWQHDGNVPLSLAPGAAPLAMLQWIALALATQMTATRFSHPDRLEPLLRCFVAGATLTLIIGVIQTLGHATRILGLYAPIQVQGLVQPLAGTFVNGNQAGALYAMAGSAGFSLFVTSSRPLRRAAGLTGAVIAAAALVIMGSFGALAALVAAGILAVAGTLLSRVSGWATGTRIQLFLIAAAGVALAAWTTGMMSFSLESRMPESAVNKLQLWRNAAHLIPESPWVGMGTGSFADLAERHAQDTLWSRFSWVESTPLQLSIDLGVPFALLLYLTLLLPAAWWLGTPSGSNQMRWRYLTIVVGTCVLVEQFLGMGLTALGVSLPAALLFGSIVGIAVRVRSGACEWTSKTNLGAIATTIVLLVASGFHLPAAVQQSLEPSANKTIRLLRTSDASQAEALIQAAAQLQPASPLLLYADGLLALRQDQQPRARHRLEILWQHAPHSALTRRLQLQLAVAQQNEDAICEALSRLLEVPGEQVRWDAMPGGAAEWMHCLPDEAALARLYMVLQSKQQPSQWLAAALADLRRSPERLLSLHAAARASLALELPESALYYADKLFQFAPRNGYWANQLMELFRLLEAPERVDSFVLDAWRVSPQDPILMVMRLELLVRNPTALAGEPDDWITAFAQARQLNATDESWWLRSLRAEATWAAQHNDWQRAARALDLYLGRRSSDQGALRERIHAAQQMADEPSRLRYQIRLQQLQAPRP